MIPVKYLNAARQFAATKDTPHVTQRGLRGA